MSFTTDLYKLSLDTLTRVTLPAQVRLYGANSPQVQRVQQVIAQKSAARAIERRRNR